MAANFSPALEFYTITDQASAQGRTDLEIAAGLIQGGATTLQYRAKKTSAAQQYKVALELAALCKAKAVPFIVNDRIDLALAVDADGVHLGQDDMPIAAARALARGQNKAFIIGKSTHSLEQAKQAEHEGADYIGFGPLFSTQTKENNVPPVGCNALKEVLLTVQVPVVAIGGIKPYNADQVAFSGARHVAIVTHLTSAGDVAQATRAMRARWGELTGLNRPPVG